MWGILPSEQDLMEAMCLTTRTSRRQILTVPNLLSILRLAMIPGIVIMYRDGRHLACGLLLAASGMTDLLDGWIARRFHAVSDLGKILDPVADKLTMAAALWMLTSSYPALRLPLLLLVVKELAMAVSGMAAVVRTDEIPGAVWHGKLTTALIYLTMFIHVLWQEIPQIMSNIMAAACTGMMLLSLCMYTIDNIRRIRRGRGGSSGDRQADW